LLSILLSLLTLTAISKQRTTPQQSETLTVKQSSGLYTGLSSSVTAKVISYRFSTASFKSFYAKNNETGSLKKNKETLPENGLAVSAFENAQSTNASPVSGPTTKQVTYELITMLNKKGSPEKAQYCSDIAFLDNNTAVTILYTKQQASLLTLDISGSSMVVTSKVNIPVINPYCTPADFGTVKTHFYIDRKSNQIIVPVNKSKETAGKDGALSWKHTKQTTPGIWIISPVKNDEKRWVIDPAGIVAYYFSGAQQEKDKLTVQTVQSDAAGNIWMNFNKGILGCLPVLSRKNNLTVYDETLLLHNFNKDAAWFMHSKQQYSDLIYNKLKGMTDEETEDTARLYKNYYNHPEAYGYQYLENAKYTLYSNLLRAEEMQLDSAEVYDNPDALWKYVQLHLDAPSDKKKKKLSDYFGYKIRQFQTLHNSITADTANGVYVTTNLGLHKLHYNEKTNSISTDWSYAYYNSFITTAASKIATTATTPVFIADKNEVAFCDNAFPHVNLLILDAQRGSIKYRFRLFESAYGGVLHNALTYSDHMLIAGNSFGNNTALKKASDTKPAGGINRFTTTLSGTWIRDYVWNDVQENNISNTAAVKIASNEKVYLYHQNEAGNWQVSAVRTDKADRFNPLEYSLSPDFKGIIKNPLNNYFGNYTFGPHKSVYTGTGAGLLRVISE
jgi:hypothetical protein